MSEYNFPHLPIATSLEEVAYYAEAVHENEYPAFQIDAKSIARRETSSYLLAELAVLTELEGANYRKSGLSIPFTERAAWPRTSMSGELATFAPHTDGIDVFRALALHRELSGNATALFGHIVDSSDLDFFASDPRFRTHGFTEIADKLENRYQAQIRPDRFTVFSEGNLPGLLPAVHYFERSRESAAAYSRTTSKVSDGTLHETELEDAANQCRLQALRDRYLWQITAHLFPYSYPGAESITEINLANAHLSEEQMEHLEHPGRYLQYVGEEDLCLVDGDVIVLR